MCLMQVAPSPVQAPAAPDDSRSMTIRIASGLEIRINCKAGN
jgi:hypothetical protein